MKKKLLFAVYDMEIGGIERSLINMLESFDYEAYEVDLLVCSHQGDFMPLIPPEVNLLPEVGPYTVFRKPVVQCIREGHYAASIIRLISKNAAALKAKTRKLNEGPGYIQMQLASKYTSYILPPLDKQYDLSVSYAWPHDLVAAKVNAKRKLAWIHTDYSRLEIDNKLDLAVWSKFDHIVSISDACTEAFVRTYPSLQSKMVTIENITSPGFIKRMAEQSGALDGWSGKLFNIVSVGRLSYVKGFDMAAEALKLLHERGCKELKWRVVGYGGYEAELRRIIAGHGMEEHFQLLGKLANPYPVMKSCDLYVQPSRYEGKAVTVTEAQILQKPVIITRYPTAASQVEDGVDGLICEMSAEGIADAIERLYRDEELRNDLIRRLGEKDYRNEEELRKLYQLIV